MRSNNPFVSGTVTDDSDTRNQSCDFCRSIAENKQKCLFHSLIICAIFLVLFYVYNFKLFPTQRHNFRLEVVPIAKDGNSAVIALYRHESLYWTRSIAQFLVPYKKLANNHSDMSDGATHSSTDCYQTHHTIINYYYCLFSHLNMHTNCTESAHFGYSSRTPCIAIKLIKQFKWKPKSYKKWDSRPNNSNNASDNSGGDTFYIRCYGETGEDNKNIGIIAYHPSALIPLNYFNAFGFRSNYLAPFIFINFPNPSRGVFIRVECKMRSERDRSIETAVQFQLYIEDE